MSRIAVAAAPIALVGTVLAVSALANAVTDQPGTIIMTHPWDYPICVSVRGQASEAVYTGCFVDWTPCPIGVALRPHGGVGSDGVNYMPLDVLPGLHTRPGEDGWGVFRVEALYEGRFLEDGSVVPQNLDDPLYYDGLSGTELVGIYGGRHDVSVVFGDPAGSVQTVASDGDQFEIYIQDHGTFQNGTGGTAARNPSDGSYPGVGDHDSSRVVLNGYTQRGFFSDPGLGAWGYPLGICPESVTTTTMADTWCGSTDLYWSMFESGDTIPADDIGASGVLGGSNMHFHSGCFWGDACPPEVYFADLHVRVNRAAVNLVNNPAFDGDGDGQPDEYNWTVAYTNAPSTITYNPVSGNLLLDTQGYLLNGFLIHSADGEFNGDANLPAGFTFNDNTEYLIASQMDNTLQGTWDFGAVVDDRGGLWDSNGWWEVDDWQFTYTLDGEAGVLTGNIEILSFLPGDVDFDGDVDAWDIQQILGCNSYLNGPGWAWECGDFNGDTYVDGNDIQMILDHDQYGEEVKGMLMTMVPEPATLGLLAVGGLVAIRRRRR